MIFSAPQTLLATLFLSILIFLGCSDQTSDSKSDAQNACRSDVETAVVEAQRARKSEADMRRTGDAALYRCLARKSR